MARAHAAGVKAFIMPSTTRERWPGLRAITRDYAMVHPAYGLHPMFMQTHHPDHLQALDPWLDENPAVAVGECGLDFFHSNDDEQDQLELFRGQLNIALNHRLPVIVHARKAMDLVLREIRQSGVRSGVVHSFSGSLQQAEQLFGLGFRLGIAATVSHDRARKLRQVVSDIDVEALLIESDAPDQPGAAHRGQRNEPAFIVDHLADMAELRDIDPDSLSKQLNANAQSLFGL